MAEPTAADRERAAELYDDFDMQWRHVDHIFELPDVVTDDLICRIAAALAEARQQQAWQPIETAPKDGTHFLAYRKNPGRHSTEINEAWWKVDILGKEGWGGTSWMYPDWDQPTHWMKLPESPK